jgi:hypothetical protein
VAKQLGHAKMTTTLLFYGHWFPKGDRHYVEQMKSVRVAATPLRIPTPHDDSDAGLDADEAVNADSWHHFGTRNESGTSDHSEVPVVIGGPSRTRTLDPLIKSPPTGVSSFNALHVTNRNLDPRIGPTGPP